MSLSANYPTTRPSLTLDFVNTPALDPRITFTRTTTATYFDSLGVMRTAAAGQARFDYNPVTKQPQGLLIEEQRTNLLTYSEQFDNAAWTKSNSFIQTNLLTFSEQFDNAVWAKNNGATVTANTTTAPDGTTTADTFTTGALASSGVFRFPTTAASTTHTLSVYLKNSSGSTDIRFGCDANPTNACIRFNPTTGLITSSEANVTASNVVDAGNGWYRISVSFVTTSTAPGIILYGMTGTVVSFHAWGAQLVQGATPGDYQQTTTTALPVGYLAPTGQLTAEKLVETTANNEHIAYHNFTYSAIPYTHSVYAKAGERTVLYVWIQSPSRTGAYFNLANGTTSNVGSGVVATITPAGNGWYRCSVTFTPSAGSGFAGYQLVSGSLVYTGDGTSGVYIWGAQLEAGAFPTSYIPTVATTLTRNADAATMTGVNFSSWFNNAEGTLFAEGNRLAAGLVSGVLVGVAQSGVFGQSIYMSNDSGTGNVLNLAVINGGSSQAAVGGVVSPSVTDVFKASLAYASNNFAGSIKGGAVATDLSGVVPTTIQVLAVGSAPWSLSGLTSWSGYIRKFSYYPRRLSNEQLQALTS